MQIKYPLSPPWYSSECAQSLLPTGTTTFAPHLLSHSVLFTAGYSALRHQVAPAPLFNELNLVLHLSTQMPRGHQSIWALKTTKCPATTNSHPSHCFVHFVAIAPQTTPPNFEPRSELFNLVCCQHRIIPQTGDNTIYHHAHLHTRTSQVHTEKEIWIIFARKPPFRSFSPHMTFMSYGLKISGWNSDFT